MQFDDDMAAKAQEAESAGQKLVYVGHVDVASGNCTVGLKVSLFYTHKPQSCFRLPAYCWAAKLE